MRRALSQSALESIRERKKLEGEALRQDIDRRIGRDITRKVADIEPATDAEARHLSELLNQRMMQYHPDARNFFSLFKQMDIDGSRRVSFNEFSQLCRRELKLGTKLVPQERLAALWKRLDENASGYVDPGELGRFMKIGAPEGGLGARTRVVMEKTEGRKLHMADLDRRHGRDLTAHIRKFNVPPVSSDELYRLSTLFNARMVELKPRAAADGRNFFRLFKHMDVDDSGRISFRELARMVREELKLGTAEMPLTKLQGLWRALDENANGFICAGEFGHFIKIILTLTRSLT